MRAEQMLRPRYFPSTASGSLACNLPVLMPTRGKSSADLCTGNAVARIAFVSRHGVITPLPGIPIIETLDVTNAWRYYIVSDKILSE
jgi:hypothetical protein